MITNYTTRTCTDVADKCTSSSLPPRPAAGRTSPTTPPSTTPTLAPRAYPIHAHISAPVCFACSCSARSSSADTAVDVRAKHRKCDNATAWLRELRCDWRPLLNALNIDKLFSIVVTKQAADSRCQHQWSASINQSSASIVSKNQSIVSINHQHHSASSHARCACCLSSTHHGPHINSVQAGPVMLGY